MDRDTHTVYAGNSSDNTVSVVDAADCNAARPRGCDREWPAVRVAGAPFYGLLDDARVHTLYVTNLDQDSISLVDTTTCNARVSTGCAATPPAVPAGRGPAGLALDRRTGTLYVADIADGVVALIATAACNAHDTSGCSRPLATVPAGDRPLAIALDESTGTLYAGDQGDDTMAVIDVRSCNARSTSGCDRTPAHVPVPDTPYGLAVDPDTATLYVANTGAELFRTGYANPASSVSVIDTSACNATRAEGCGRPATSVPTGGMPWNVAIDGATHAVYVTSIVDSTVAAIDGTSCNGRRHRDCRARPLREGTGGWPADIGLDPADGTIYVTDNVDAALSVLRLPRP